MMVQFGVFALMFTAGLAIPVMAALNSGLALRLESPGMATVILFMVATGVSAAYTLTTSDVTGLIKLHSVPIWFFGGGILIAFYATSIAWAAPRIGVSSAISLVLTGQLVTVCFLDHYGLFGILERPLTTYRVVGLTTVFFGALLVVRN